MRKMVERRCIRFHLVGTERIDNIINAAVQWCLTLLICPHLSRTLENMEAVKYFWATSGISGLISQN